MRKINYIIILLFLPLSLLAQERDDMIRQGKEVLDNIMNTKGEDVYKLMNGEMKSAVTSPQLNALWTGLIMQFGPCKEVTYWKNRLIGNNQVVTSRLHFEKQSLMFMISFYDGKINGLRFMPEPVEEKKNETLESTESFQEKAIMVTSGKFNMPGVLTLPKKGCGFSCVILVHGSGAHDRNETLNENRPFKDLAHGLARLGIASIRYDKRTLVYGADCLSEGQELNFKSEVTDDVLSAIKLAYNEKDINAKNIFVLGHSMGGMLAPRIATLYPDIKGIIMMAANARPFEELVMEQITYLNTLHPSPGWEEHLSKLKIQFDNVKKLGTADFDSSIALPLGLPASYWQDLNSYHQIEIAKTLDLPVFILNGERDYNVTMTDYNLWKQELRGRKNVTFKSYPVLNHLFMESSEIPTPKDYETPRHIPDYVMEDIADWIEKQK